MSFIELAKKRYSVRSYKDQAVEPDKLEKILEAGIIAPTGANRQPFQILVIESEQGRSKVAKAANTFSAPLILVICAEDDKSWTRSYDGFQTSDIDASIVTDHMMLEAEELGLGSVWICKFDPDTLRSELAIPSHLRAVNILAVGYSNETKPKSPDRHSSERQPVSDLVSFEAF